MCLLLASGLASLAAPGPSRDHDARVEHNRGFPDFSSSRQRPELPPGTVATFHPDTGAARSLRNPTGLLTDTRVGGGDSAEIALEYVRSNLSLLGLSDADLDEYEITDVVYSEVTGATHVYLRQAYRGLPVYGAQLQVNINRDGHILGINNSFLPDIGEAGLGESSTPALEADDCTAAAGQDVGIESRSRPRISHRGKGRGRRTRLSWQGSSPEPIDAQLMWLPVRVGELRLVWNLQLQTEGSQDLFDFTVDASSGKVWTRFNLTRGAQYRVYAQPAESPNDVVPLPPADGRSLVVDPADSLASPGGWHAVGTTEMRGNNAETYADPDANDLPPGVEPNCGADLNCDFALDLTAPPANSVAAAVANVFYWTNAVHDIQYQYGFDEAAGNFQEDNFGRGGFGLDSVIAEVQDGSGECNADFTTPPDGASPRMQMFICGNTFPGRDGGFDNGVIIHELAHGISLRQVGGPSSVTCLSNTQQWGEGFSDWLALVYTARAGDQRTDARTVGTWLLGQSADGPGARAQPYSTDPTVNDFSYESINGATVPDGVGSVWAQALWEMYWALVDVHGFNPDLRNPSPGWAGNQRALLYANEGLKNTICSPTFTDSRDAILQVAIDNFGGEDLCTLWRAFANFGLGSDATSGGPNSLAAVNGFSVPGECQGVGNAAPTVSISSPLTGVSFSEGESIAFAGTASDPEDGVLTAGLSWASDLDGAIGSGGSFSELLSVGSHTVTASVSDSSALSASASVAITIETDSPTGPNTAPTVNITGPANRAKFRDTFPVFTAVVSDAEDADLSGSLIWTSNQDGELGRGSPLAASLSDGRHQITVSVADSGGLSASDTLARIECKGECIAPAQPEPGPAPVAGLNATPTSGTSPLTVLFSDASSGVVDDRSLDYGDGTSPSTTANGSHTYASAGSFTATLTVNGPGGSDSTSRTISVNDPAPGPEPAQLVVVIGGPTSVGRGDNASFSVTITNLGNSLASGLAVSLGITPARRIKRLSPGGLVAIAALPPGGSVSQTWSGRADKQGSATVRAEVFTNGVSVAVETRALTIVK